MIVQLARVIKNATRKFLLSTARQLQKCKWLYWPSVLTGSFGLLVGAGSFTFGLGAYLWGGTQLSFLGMAVLCLYLVLLFLSAYLAATHLARLLGIYVLGLLGENAKIWAAIPALALGVALAVSPGTDLGSKAHAGPGGLAFLTSSSVIQADIDVSPQNMSSTDRLVAVDVKLAAKGKASLAIVGSGPAEFDFVALTQGDVRMVSLETEQNKGDERKAMDLPKRSLPLALFTDEPIDAHDAVQSGHSGMYVARDDMLAPELPGQWFASDSARAFAINLTATADSSYEQTFSFVLRLRPGLGVRSEEGDLGEVGCPNALVGAYSQHNGDGSTDGGLFKLATADLPLTTPRTCNVRILIGYGSNLSATIAGEKREVESYEPLFISSESKTVDGTDRTALRNSLTLSRSDWQLTDKKKKSPLEEGWETVRENFIWAVFGFGVLQLWLALLPRLQGARSGAKPTTT